MTRRSPRLGRLLSGFVVVAAAGACAPAARAPAVTVDLPLLFDRAFGEEATGDAHRAVEAYLGVVAAAAGSEGVPWRRAALQAALDALVTREIPSLGDAAGDAALVGRSGDAPRITAALEREAGAARGAPERGLVARALEALAVRRGDAAAA
ncbi:MAG: hypothetical protein JOZ69_09635, partial [Myxococcales bacterium]|nr:hypothetical protein [Myxococcales bacterium]